MVLGFLPSRQFGVSLADRGNRHDSRERVRERLHAPGTQPLELRAPVVVGFRAQRSIFVILSLRCGPRGTGTEIVSPRLRPSSALPTGDSFDSFISLGFASAEPTILYFTDFSVFWSLTCTIEPTDTTSVDTAPSSITDAERSLSSSSAICFSSIACSFLASSYSEFSEMSPKARASLIRSATSSRRVVERCSIFAFRSSSPCAVRRVSLAISTLVRLCGRASVAIGQAAKQMVRRSRAARASAVVGAVQRAWFSLFESPIVSPYHG